ncbi:MAG: DUF4397 domain-containing protein [Polyangiales bacterium]
MRITLTKLAAITGLAVLSGCQAIAGTESRQLDPVLDGCTLPTTGGGKVRFANLVPDDDVVDLCIRPSGGAYGRPVLRGAGTGCGKALGRADAGYAYAEVSIPFASPSGKIDVRVIKAGDTCAGTALTEGTNLDVAAGGMSTIVRLGNEKGQSVKAFPDDTTLAVSGNSKFRLLHAAPGIGALDWALTSSTALPAQLEAPLLSVPLDFGTSTTPKTPPAGVGKVDENGYLELPGTAFNVAAAPTGTKKAVLLAPLPAKEAGRTIYAIGDPAKPFFQVRALVCNDSETDGLKTACKLSQLGTISVDVFNAYLYGAFAPDQDIRRPKVLDTIAGRDSDIQCIVSLNRQADRDEAIRRAKEKGFLYSYVSTTDQSTTATDPRDQNGKTPDPYTTPPCGGTVKPEESEAVVQCIQDNCTADHTGSSILKAPYDSSCMSSSCAVPFIPLLGGDRDHKRCMSCLATGAVSDNTMDQVRDKCTKQVADFKAFDGQTDSVIISRFPLTNTESYILPATPFQRVIHYAQLEIEKGKFVDFYCGEFTAAYGELLPYYGNYAPGSGDGWYQEQLLQAQRLLDYVKKKSGTKAAIITGDWAASRQYIDPMTMMKTIDDQNGAVFDLLEKPGNFIAALPKNFTPRCTECAAPENPYNADQNIWQFKTYVYNLPSTSGVEVNYYATDINAVSTPAGPRPITDRWGYNTRILRP